MKLESHSAVASCDCSFVLSNLPRVPYNNYSMSLSWIWSGKITNERVARVGYNHFISNKGEWNNCFSKFSNRVLPPIFISTFLQSGKFLNLAHYFPYDVKLRLLADSRSFLANQKARNAIVGVANLLKLNSTCYGVYHLLNLIETYNKYMLFVGWEVRMVKNCDLGPENAALGRTHRP